MLKHDADVGCSSGICSPSALGQNQDAITDGNISTAAIAAGAVGIVVGTILFLTRGGSSSASTTWNRLPVARIAGAEVSLGSAGPGVDVAGRW
jgi:hypothetical protein